MSHLCKLRHRKKIQENSQKFISQERQVRILIESAYRLYFHLLLKSQLGFLSKYHFHTKS